MFGVGCHCQSARRLAVEISDRPAFSESSDSLITYHLSLITARPASILFVADVFHPIYDFTVQRFLDGDMRHRSRRRRAVPMLLVRRKPNDIAWPDFLDRSVPTLRPPEARRNDQRLTE